MSPHPPPNNEDDPDEAAIHVAEQASSPWEKALREKVLRAKRAQEAVGTALDALKDEFVVVEKALRGLSLTVAAQVELYSEHNHEEQWWDEGWLVYKHTSAGWKFVIESADASDPDGSTLELVKASKNLRLLAAQKLPALVDAIVENAEKDAKTAEQALVDVRSLGASLVAMAGKK